MHCLRKLPSIYIDANASNTADKRHLLLFMNQIGGVLVSAINKEVAILNNILIQVIQE